MIRALIFWALGVVSLIFVYVLSGAIAALALALGLIFVLALSALSARYAVGRIKVGFKLPPELGKGKLSICILKVENRTIIPVSRVAACIQIRNALTGEIQKAQPDFALRHKEKKNMQMELHSTYCGQLKFSCESVKIYDWFGIFSFNHIVEISSKRMVRPETFPMVSNIISAKALEGDDEHYFNKKGTENTEMLQMREYAQGDSFKKIHWKLSQKFDKLIVTDHAQPIARAILLFWDKSTMSQIVSPAVHDVIAESFVSLCLSLCENSIIFSIAWTNPFVDEFFIEDISDINDFYDAIPGILLTSPSAQAKSGIGKCVSGLESRVFPIIVYFASSLPDDISVLSERAKVTAAVCSESASSYSLGDITVLPFSPQDYKTALGEIYL